MFKILFVAILAFAGHAEAAQPAYEGTRVSTATGQATKYLNGTFYIGRSSPTWDAPESTPTITLDGTTGSVGASTGTFSDSLFVGVRQAALAAYKAVVRATTDVNLAVTHDGAGGLRMAAVNDSDSYIAWDFRAASFAMNAGLTVGNGNIRVDNNQGVEFGGSNNFIYGNESSDFVAVYTNGAVSVIWDSAQHAFFSSGIDASSATINGNFKAVGTTNLQDTLTLGSASQGTMTWDADDLFLRPAAGFKLNLGSNGTDGALVIDGGKSVFGGVVSAPSQPAVNAYRGSDATIPNNSWTRIYFGSTRYNKNNLFDATNSSGTVTLQTGFDGNYGIICATKYDLNTSGLRGIRIVINGSEEAKVLQPATQATDGNAMSLSYSRNLVATDTVQCETVQTSGGDLNINATFSYMVVRKEL